MRTRSVNCNWHESDRFWAVNIQLSVMENLFPSHRSQSTIRFRCTIRTPCVCQLSDRMHMWSSDLPTRVWVRVKSRWEYAAEEDGQSVLQVFAKQDSDSTIRPIRVDHTNFFQVVINTHSFFHKSFISRSQVDDQTVVYYESIKRELKIRSIYECRVMKDYKLKRRNQKYV